MRDRLVGVADLVDMEGYAVVMACQTFGVPVRVVKHVSDDADSQALEWLERVQISARELAGASNVLFRRNSQSGAVEALARGGKGIELNAELHGNQ